MLCKFLSRKEYSVVKFQNIKMVFFHTFISPILFIAASELSASSSYDLTKAFDIGDPISANTRTYYFELPTFDLGGSLPVRYAYSYSSKSSFESGRFKPAVATIQRMSLSGLSVVNWGSGRELLSFRNSETNASGVWTSGDNIYKYQLQEEKGSYAWFYLMDSSDQSVYIFEKNHREDDSGMQDARLRYHIDRNGNQVSYDYVTWNFPYRARTITDNLGRTITISTANSETEITISNGTRQFEIISRNSYNEFTSITDPLGNKTIFEYQTGSSGWPDKCITKKTQPKGNTPYTQTYVGEYDCTTTSQTDAYNNRTSLEWTAGSLGWDSNSAVLETRPDDSEIVYRHVYGAPTSLKDAQGNEASFSVNDNAQMTTITDRLGDTTSMTYHADTGFLSSFTNAEGNTLSHAYTAQTQSFINPANSHSVTFTFYNRTRTDYPDATFETFAYDTKGNLLTHTDRNTQSTTYTYNTQGLPLTITNPTGGVMTNTYNADGTLASNTDSDREVTTYSYDTFKRLNSINPPGAGQIDIVYDAMNRVTSLTDENSHNYQYEYDANGNLIKKRDPLGNFTQYAYDLMDRVSQITNRSSSTSTMSYNYRGQLSSFTDANTIKTDYGYNDQNWLQSVTRNTKSMTFTQDKEGMATSTTTATGRTIQQASDKLGYLKAITTPDGKITRITRNTMTNVTDILDPLSQNTHYNYDNEGRLLQVRMPDSTFTTYNRNNLGKVTQIKDFNGKNWNFTYSTMGRLDSMSDPLAKVTSYTYNIRNYLSTISYPDSSTQTLSYDNSTNITQRLFSDGTSLDFTYNALDNVSTTNDVILSRDKEERITSSSYRGVSFGVTYDAGGRVATATYNGALSVTYSYNTDNRLNRVSDTLGNSISITYDADGNPLTLVRSNGVNTTLTWDANSRLTRLKDGTFTDLALTYDAAGQIIALQGTIPLEPTQYMTESTKSFTVDAASRINSSGYSYDNRGRVTAMPGHILSWDAAERLSSLDGIDFEYNGFNEIISRADTTNTTYYYHNHGLSLNPIVAEQENNIFSRYYIYTPSGELLYAVDPQNANAVSFYHRDQIGSTLALSDNTGTLTDRYAYTPYGKVLAHIGNTNQPYTFVGTLGVRQEGDLYQMRLRYYDPQTARFLSKEAIWPRISDPKMFNPYQYVAQNPLRFVDPKGTMKHVFEDAAYWDNIAAEYKYTMQENAKLVEKAAGFAIITLATSANMGSDVQDLKDTAKKVKEIIAGLEKKRDEAGKIARAAKKWAQAIRKREAHTKGILVGKREIPSKKPNTAINNWKKGRLSQDDIQQKITSRNFWKRVLSGQGKAFTDYLRFTQEEKVAISAGADMFIDGDYQSLYGLVPESYWND